MITPFCLCLHRCFLWGRLPIALRDSLFAEHHQIFQGIFLHWRTIKLYLEKRQRTQQKYAILNDLPDRPDFYNWMNEVNIRRSKIKREINNKQKQDYFQYRRKQLLCSIEPSVVEDTPVAAALRNLINRSLIHNHLLEDLRQKALLEMINRMLQQTNQGRVVELILVLLGNLLLDDLTLNQKQSISQSCVQAYQSEALSKYVYKDNEKNLSCMLSLSHNLSSLCTVLAYIEEQLALACEKIIMKEVVRIVKQIVSLVVLREKGDQSLQNCLRKTCKNINEIFARMLYCDPQYKGEVRTRFDRNSSFFFNLLQSHYQLLPYVMDSPHSQILHEGLLCVQQLLSKEITMAEYPVYFESKFFLSVCLQQIFCGREQKWTNMSFQILIALLIEYQKINIYSILHQIQTTINQLGGQQFFRRLLTTDNLELSRLTLLHLFICSQAQLSIFAQFFKQHWKNLIDLCFDALKTTNTYNKQAAALKLLIVISEKVDSNSECKSYRIYVQSIGGEALLEQINSQCLQLNYYQRNEQIQTILEQIYVLFEIIKEP